MSSAALSVFGFSLTKRWECGILVETHLFTLEQITGLLSSFELYACSVDEDVWYFLRYAPSNV